MPKFVKNSTSKHGHPPKGVLKQFDISPTSDLSPRGWAVQKGLRPYSNKKPFSTGYTARKVPPTNRSYMSKRYPIQRAYITGMLDPQGVFPPPSSVEDNGPRQLCSAEKRELRAKAFHSGEKTGPPKAQYCVPTFCFGVQRSKRAGTCCRS